MTTGRITKQPVAKSNKPQTNRAFERHQRKCVICHHPDREAIEEEFVHWNTVWRISKQYGIGDYRSIYRHAHATHLTERRRENLRSALDHIVESVPETTPTGDCILRAIRAYSCVDSLGRWVDPPSQVNFSTVPAAQPAAQPSPIIDVVDYEPPHELHSNTELDPGPDPGPEPFLNPVLHNEILVAAFEPGSRDARALDQIYRGAIRTGLNTLKT